MVRSPSGERSPGVRITFSTRYRFVPNIESAKKRIRQDKKRHARNKWRKQRIRLQIRAFSEAVRLKDVKVAEEEFRKVCSILDKVSSTSTMHKNTAARKKSRLAAHLKALRAA